MTSTDVAALERLGIDRDLLALAQVRRVDDVEARQILCCNGRSGRMDGILFPYLHPRDVRPVSYRVRRDHPEIERGKPKNKYMSAAGERKRLYFAPGVAELLADVSVPVVQVEAEKSVLAITSAAKRQGRRLLAVGQGGDWGWRGRIGKVGDVDGVRVDEVGPLPDLDLVTWTARDVVIVFDAGAAHNPKVQAARRALARELTGRGAKVRIVDLPPDGGVNGPDDFIGAHSDAAFFTLIDAAVDVTTADVIFRLNERHAVLREAGKTVVITQERDPILERGIVTRSSFADFRNYYMRETVDVGTPDEPKPVQLGHYWLSHPDRRQYEGIVMAPAGDVPGYLNLWQGFAVQPAPGSWSRFREHVYEVICRGNDTLYDYVVAWMAAGVQHPDRPAEVAIAVRGNKGTGKGVWARTYGELFGQHYLQIANSKHLIGNFNAHLQDCVVLFADEAFWAGDKAGESVLKMLITEPVIPIERKGRDVVLAKNLLHVIIASNSDWVVPAGMNERRFCVLDVADTYLQDHEHFAGIKAELDAGGRAALLYDLLNYDLAGLNLRQVPQTEALRQQKVFSMAPIEKWVFDKLMAGQWLPEHDGYVTIVSKDALHADYVRTLQGVGVTHRSTQTELGMYLTKVFGKHLTETRRTIDGQRARCWQMSNLSGLRAAFDHATDAKHPWPDPDPGDE